MSELGHSCPNRRKRRKMFDIRHFHINLLCLSAFCSCFALIRTGVSEFRLLSFSSLMWNSLYETVIRSAQTAVMLAGAFVRHAEAVFISALVVDTLASAFVTLALLSVTVALVFVTLALVFVTLTPAIGKAALPFAAFAGAFGGCYLR
jgi:hypothetical protein